MSDSILTSIKKVLGIDEGLTVFDVDVQMHTNSALSKLTQIGVGPEHGFAISGPGETWADFVGNDPRLNSVKTFVFLSVKLVFDPPPTSYLISAYKEQIDEISWRLAAKHELDQDDPDGGSPDHNNGPVLDGGTP